MGLIERHGDAPFINGELLPAVDLETDISRPFAELAGNLDDSNVAAAADIDGSVLLNNSVHGDRFKFKVLEADRLADGAVGLGNIVDGAVDDDRIDPAANISQVVYELDQTPREAPIFENTITLDTLAMTISADAAYVLHMIHWIGRSTNDPDTGQSGTEVRLDSGTTLLRFWRLGTEAIYNDKIGRLMFLFHVEVLPTAGAVTYTLEQQNWGSVNERWEIDETSWVAIEMKR